MHLFGHFRVVLPQQSDEDVVRGEPDGVRGTMVMVAKTLSVASLMGYGGRWLWSKTLSVASLMGDVGRWL
jgi:hypothetical protein